MRILLTETRNGAAEAAARTLEDAGHQVLSCSSHDAPSFPCRGLDSGDCPLDEQVDVAVAVRAESEAEPTPGEMGITCALRQRLPLVVVGPGDESQPFAPWTTASLEQPDDQALLDAVGEAARAELPGHARVAAEEVLRRVGSEAVEAKVRRRGNGVSVTVRVPMVLEPQERETLGVHVAGAIRRFDRWTGVIDVRVDDPTD